MNEPLPLTLLPLSALPIISYPSETTGPSVFISYSQFSTEHKEWVALLAQKLEQLGIKVNYDGNFDGSQRFDRFMESLAENDFVICVLSASYVEKIKKNEPCGVVKEINVIKDKETECNLENFVIPILKDSTPESKNNIPRFFKNILYWNFDDENKAPAEFSKMVCRILAIEEKIVNIHSTIPENHIVCQQKSDLIRTTLANYWNLKHKSFAEIQLSKAFLTGDIFKNSNSEIITLGITQQTSDNMYKEKDINLLGRWDSSFSGDQEILELFAGDSSDE